jgi:hypothetical protein
VSVLTSDIKKKYDKITALEQSENETKRKNQEQANTITVLTTAKDTIETELNNLKESIGVQVEQQVHQRLLRMLMMTSKQQNQ